MIFSRFVVTSEAKQIQKSLQELDCFVAYTPRNDGNSVAPAA